MLCRHRWIGTGSRKEERGAAAEADPTGVGQLGGREQVPVLKGRDDFDTISKQMRVSVYTNRGRCAKNPQPHRLLA